MTDALILDAILKREGGYIDSPHDKGKCTNLGITRQTLSDWRGHDVSCDDVRRLTEAEAREIYTARYLRPFDGIDPDLKPQVVDIAVNAGVARARQLLAIAQQGPRPVAVQLVVERINHYARLVRADPTQAAFIVGWFSRAVEFL